MGEKETSKRPSRWSVGACGVGIRNREDGAAARMEAIDSKLQCRMHRGGRPPAASTGASTHRRAAKQKQRAEEGKVREDWKTSGTGDDPCKGAVIQQGAETVKNSEDHFYSQKKNIQLKKIEY